MPKFEIITPSSFDTRTFQVTHEVVSTHASLDEAKAEVERLVDAQLSERWPHRPEMRNVIEDEFEIRELA